MTNLDIDIAENTGDSLMAELLIEEKIRRWKNELRVIMNDIGKVISDLEKMQYSDFIMEFLLAEKIKELKIWREQIKNFIE